MKKYLELFFIFFKIGATTFGGGYAMLPIIYRELCETHKLFEEAEMEEIVILSQAMPGAMAINCATQAGYRLHGKRGAMVCALATVLPSYLIIIFLAGLLLRYSDNIYLLRAFTAIRATVTGMICAAGLKMLRPLMKDGMQILIIIATFGLSMILTINPVWFILAGGVVGWILSGREQA